MQTDIVEIMRSNVICLCLVFIETLVFNGIFAGWSIICDMFKKDQMFIDYCDKLDNDQLDCSRRDKLFNDVFTFSIIMYNLGALLGGIVNDKVGFFYGQIINVLPNIVGLVVFAFIEHDERLIWAGWPLACFGMSGQNVMNYQFCRLGRQYYATCVALCGGCFVAAGMMTLVMAALHNGGVTYAGVFLAWATFRLVILITRSTFLTPVSIPGKLD